MKRRPVLRRIRLNRTMFAETRINRQQWRYVLILLSIWTAFGLFFGTQNYIRDVYFGRPASLPGYIIGWVFCGYSWGILTYPVVRFIRRFSLTDLSLTRFVLVHAPAAFLFSLVQLGIYLMIASILSRSSDHTAWDFYKFLLANELHSSVLVYFAIVSVVTVYDRFLARSQAKDGSGHAISQ